MNDDTKIKYTFYNAIGEFVEMTYTILQVEGMTGGFIKHVQSYLDEINFGKPVKVYRMLL